MNLYFPEWYGGAEALRALIGTGLLHQKLASRGFVDVPVSGAQGLPILDDIKAKPHLLDNIRAVHGLLEQAQPRHVRVLGGDCRVSFVPITYLNAVHAPDVAVVWLDTHPDINTPTSSSSKHFHGMVLRAALGETDADLLAFAGQPLEPSQVF